MKISLALGPRQPLSRQTAWGCLTTNLTVPGLGSLVAGRRCGYVQLALGVAGLVLSGVFGVRFIIWLLSNWARLTDAVDPVAALAEMWGRLRWALLGIGLFGMGWLWGLWTGYRLVHEARDGPKGEVPPAFYR